MLDGRRHRDHAASARLRPRAGAMQIVFQDPYASLTRGSGRSTPSRPRCGSTGIGRGAERRGPRRRSCSDRRPRPRLREPAPTRAVGRPAPARGHRARARRQAGDPDAATSRCPRSTCRSRRRSSTCCSGLQERSASATCSSATICRWSNISPTASPSCILGEFVEVGDRCGPRASSAPPLLAGAVLRGADDRSVRSRGARWRHSDG